jgi:hypothetical protein
VYSDHYRTVTFSAGCTQLKGTCNWGTVQNIQEKTRTAQMVATTTSRAEKQDFLDLPLCAQGEIPLYPLDSTLGGPQSRTQQHGEVKLAPSILPLLTSSIDKHGIQLVACNSYCRPPSPVIHFNSAQKELHPYPECHEMKCSVYFGVHWHLFPPVSCVTSYMVSFLFLVTPLCLLLSLVYISD